MPTSILIRCLRRVGGRFPVVPIEPHFRYILKLTSNVQPYAAWAQVRVAWERRMETPTEWGAHFSTASDALSQPYESAGVLC